MGLSICVRAWTCIVSASGGSILDACSCLWVSKMMEKEGDAGWGIRV